MFIGKPLGAIYGYVQDGIVQEDDIEYMELTGAKPGYPKYKDLDGKPGITADDRTILGYTKPNFSLNMGNELNFKNFNLYMMVVGVFGGITIICNQIQELIWFQVQAGLMII